jgi:membrane-bound lytic murein transglycosylase D
MQLVLNISKYILIVVLSWCLLITWHEKEPSISDLAPIFGPIIEPIVINPTPAKTHAKPSKPTVRVDSIWSSISSDFKLDHRAQTSQVKAEIRKLLADQAKFNQILKAATPYIYFIHSQTQAKGLPAEIALIPVVESEFNPNDHSIKGATGLWQLMRGTAKELGIKVISSYDGRRNVVFSTTAALAYLNDLGSYFKGNWYLAFAAYNAGQVKVDKARRRSGSNSFWNLSLPKETTYYVPKLLAVAAIIKNPEQYGVKLPHVSNEPYFTELKLDKALTLEKVSKSTGISLDVLKKLNPDYKNGTAIAKKGAYTLLVPIDKLPVVKNSFGNSIIK